METETKDSMKILYVEDDFKYAKIIKERLTSEGFQVEIAETRSKANLLFHSYRPDIALVDLDLQKPKEGLDIISDFRCVAKWFPIIVYSNDSEPETVIKAAKRGAIQHFSKSRSIEELVAIINNCILFSYRFQEKTLIQYNLSEISIFNTQTNTLFINEQQYRLKKTEGRLLQQLCTHINEYVSPQELNVAVWDTSDKSTEELRRYISKLRKIIEANDPSIKIINKAGGYYQLECLEWK